MQNASNMIRHGSASLSAMDKLREKTFISVLQIDSGQGLLCSLTRILEPGNSQNNTADTADQPVRIHRPIWVQCIPIWAI